MLESRITITRKVNRPARSRCCWLWMVLFIFLARSIQPGGAVETSSFGFIFDRFNLTLEVGYRTETAGPFFYSQQTEDERTLAFPPFYSSVSNPSVEYTDYDFLYPLLTRVQYGREWRWQLFQLISFSGGQESNEADKTRHTLFPFY